VPVRDKGSKAGLLEHQADETQRLDALIDYQDQDVCSVDMRLRAFWPQEAEKPVKMGYPP
jgi:hypothetical protein